MKTKNRNSLWLMQLQVSRREGSQTENTEAGAGGVDMETQDVNLSFRNFRTQWKAMPK